MSFWETIKHALQKRSSFMAMVGWTLIASMILLDFYELIQLNYFFGKNKLVIENYERLVSLILTQLKEHSMIALLYYFGQKTLQKNEDSGN
jgi:uncharacterized membrane protein YjfL (UPF0719 family)